MATVIDVVIPVKHLDRAKSRLRGAHPDHRALVLAVVRDTVTAAVAAPGVRSVLVVCEDERVVAGLGGTGADCVDERGLPGLNAALRFGARVLRGRDPGAAVAALQADLPALVPADLGAAIAEAGGRRAYVPDHSGRGTVLLISAPGGRLDPRFGQDSAARHAESAVAVGWGLASLRHDVDTPGDLVEAARLGLGGRTAALWPGTRGESSPA